MPLLKRRSLASHVRFLHVNPPLLQLNRISFFCFAAKAPVSYFIAARGQLNAYFQGWLDIGFDSWTTKD